MAIEQKNVIDSVGIDKKTGEVVLSIIDDNDWGDELTHIYLLQEKINSYISCIESGELFHQYEKAKGKKIRFDLIMKYNYTNQAKEFFDKVTTFLRDNGYSFNFSVLSE